ncbi:MAG: hypothetical protein AB8B86_13435 [Pseudomonadales bacterium]
MTQANSSALPSKTTYQTAFNAQATHAFLCIVWNVVGMWQNDQGMQSIGPTASLTVVSIAALLLCSLWLSLHLNWQSIYLALSCIAFTAAAMAIYGGFTKSQELWPSEFWRIAGIVVNLIGVLGFALAVKAFASQRHRI